MSVSDRTRNARAKKKTKSSFKAIKASHARQWKVSNAFVNNNTNIMMANHAKTIKNLRQEITSLKRKLTKLSNASSNNVNNQSTADKLHQIETDINAIMNEMHVSTHGQSYDRYLFVLFKCISCSKNII